MKGNNMHEAAATTTVSKAAASSKLIESGIETRSVNAKPNVNNANSKANENTDTNDNEDSMANTKPNHNTDSKTKPNDTKDSNANEYNHNVKANKNADSNLDYKPVQFPPPLAIFMPSTEKDSDALYSGGGISFTTGSQSGKFSYGFSSFKGKRPSMEDFFETQISEVNGQMVAFFGVFDGHGGSKTAEYLKNNLFQNLTSHPDFVKDTKTAIVEVFKQTDADYINDEKSQNKDAGSTASTALLLGDRLFVANVGDSRVVAGRAGSAVPLSNDHKPDRSDERERIEQAGGFIIWAGTWRVGGVLAVSRAFGDKLLKPFVVAEPEIQEEEIGSVDFIILASDGLWNVISNKEAVALVQDIKEAEESSRKLITEAYARGSTDNITCVVVRFDIS